MKKDRRKSARLELIPINLKILNSSKERSVASIIDLSKDGSKIRINTHFLKGKDLTIFFPSTQKNSNSRNFIIHASKVWEKKVPGCTYCDIGCEFHELSKYKEKKLSLLLDYLKD